MAKSFQELRAMLSPEAQARAEERAQAMSQVRAFTPDVLVSPQCAQQLRARWQEPPWRELGTTILAALAKHAPLPDNIPEVRAQWLGHEFKLLDLRGFDFSGLELGEEDLSYCCLDFALFRRTKLHGTALQYSTFAQASFDDATWLNVQASPIFGPGLSLQRAWIEESFLMGSALPQADLRGATILKTSLADVERQGTLADAASQFTEVGLDADAIEQLTQAHLAR